MNVDIRYTAMQLALSQCGYKEKARNWNIYARDIKAPQHAPYCAIKTAWDYRYAFDFRDIFTLPWYVPGIWSDAKRLGITTSKPVDGDLVIYDWTMNNDPDHIGLAYPSHGSRYAVEGNTGPGNAGSQSDGGGVYLRQRPASDIVGYVSIAKLAAKFKFPLSSTVIPALPVIRIGARGDYAKRVQRGVGAKADGVFGNDTLALVKSFQARHKLAADGVVGAATWEALGSPVAVPVALTRPKVRRGDRGNAVREVQRAVGAAADGVFGGETLAKVKAYQKRKGLAADGVIGAATWSAIHGRPVRVN